MNTEQRLAAFIKLGQYLQTILLTYEVADDSVKILSKVQFKNPWFTPDNLHYAFNNIVSLLDEEQICSWISSYDILEQHPKTIAVIMNGDTPCDGFHDALCVLITGNKLLARLPETDNIAIRFVLQKLIEIEPAFADFIEFSDGIIKNFDAVICRKDNPYFKKKPHLIRNKRSSIAVLNGNENDSDLTNLGNDIFLYFGLGYRNVSKIYMPQDFDEKKLLDAIEQYNSLSMHYKYMNNYEYNKSVYLVTQQKHFDNGFLILKEDSKIKSPIAVVFYEKYSVISSVQRTLKENATEIQYIVGNNNCFFKESINFGCTQKQKITEYENDIDTISFILNI